MANSTADPSTAPAPPRSSRRDILLRFGLVATLPLLALALIHGAIFARQNRLAAENQLACTAQSVGQRLRSHIAQHRQAVITLAGLIETDQDFTSRHVATVTRSG